GAVCPRGGAAEHHCRMIEPDQTVGDRISEPALFADFLIEPRIVRAAAENVIDHISGHEIGILAGNSRPTEIDDRLRDIEADFDPTPEPMRRYIGDRI